MAWRGNGTSGGGGGGTKPSVRQPGQGGGTEQAGRERGQKKKDQESWKRNEVSEERKKKKKWKQNKGGGREGKAEEGHHGNSQPPMLRLALGRGEFWSGEVELSVARVEVILLFLVTHIPIPELCCQNKPPSISAAAMIARMIQ